MEKNRICKICNRRFANGKAMGGHMRSHLAKLPLPPKPIPSEASILKSPSRSSSSSSFNYTSSENPMQSYRSINHELPFMSKTNLAALQDDESETESSRNPTRRRSKRSRKPVEKVAESKEVEEYMEEEAEAEDEDEDDYESIGEIQRRSKNKMKHKCETCQRSFRSYQALGGHKASHKKIKINLRDNEYEEEEGSGSGGIDSKNGVLGVKPRIFKCPFCDKVFESGQALGGHKKVHFSYLGNAKISVKSSDNLLDLNLPAPEDDGEVSQAEVSTVSNRNGK
uniref:C2H2-type domain-containing protein n=1 Tax=Manihot esculenta TaxID=3983 RepID=A0A2C9UIP4_MANES